MDPLVSVTITTKNEEKNIENCIKSILEQTYKDIEIIVVDNNSTDKTKEIALKYTNKVFDKGPERSAQRNYGMIDKSNGKYVMFIDADMILAPDVVWNCIKKIENEDIDALWVPEIVLGNNFFSKCRRFERTFYNGTVIDGARFFKKDIFIEVGGFDISMSGPEDWDIDKKLKTKNKKLKLLENNISDKNNWSLYGFIKERGVDSNKYGSVIYHNEANFNLKKYLSKKGYYAKSFDGYIDKWSEDDEDIKKQFGLIYRYFGVFLENGKWKKLLLHPLLAIGMYFLRFLVGVSFLINKK